MWMAVCAAFYNRPPVPMYKVDAEVWNEEGLGNTTVHCQSQWRLPMIHAMYNVSPNHAIELVLSTLHVSAVCSHQRIQ